MILSMQYNGCARFAPRNPSRVDRIKSQTGSHQPPALFTLSLSFSLSPVLPISDYYTLSSLKMQHPNLIFCINSMFSGKNLSSTNEDPSQNIKDETKIAQPPGYFHLYLSQYIKVILICTKDHTLVFLYCFFLSSVIYICDKLIFIQFIG